MTDKEAETEAMEETNPEDATAVGTDHKAETEVGTIQTRGLKEETVGVEDATAETAEITEKEETLAEIVEGTETTLGAEIEAEIEDSNKTDHNPEEETTGSHRLVKSVNKKDTPMTNVRWSRR